MAKRMIHCFLIASLVFTLAGAFPQTARAAGFTINDFGDAPDANLGNASCATSTGTCTLRAAVQQANALAGTDIITFPAGTITLGSRIDITSQVEIRGAAKNTSLIDGGNTVSDGFTISAAGNLYIENVGIQHFQTAVANYGSFGAYQTNFLYNSRTSGDGGAVRNHKSMVCADCVFGSNTAAANGGAIVNAAGATLLSLVESPFSSNLAQNGAAIYLTGAGNFYIEKGMFLNNQASVNGGAIYSIGGTHTIPADIRIIGSLFSENTAALGGAIYLNNSPMQIEGSSIYNGSATQCGGGIYQDNTGSNKYLRVVNTTISDNTSPKNGGGVCVNKGYSSWYNVSIVENTADSDGTNGGDGDGGGMYIVDAANSHFSIVGTILADNNDDSTGFGFFAPDCKGTISAGSYNLIGLDNALCTVTVSGTGNVISTVTQLDAQLDGPLYDSVTQTYYYKPSLTSPALNGGFRGGCLDFDENPLTTDQINTARPQQGTCDIGAIETVFYRIMLPLVVRP